MDYDNYRPMEQRGRQGYNYPRPPKWTTKSKIQYSILGVAMLGGLVLLGRHFIRKVQTNQEQAKTYEEGNPATYAKQIKMAFENDGWWGTNTEALRTAIQSVKSKSEFRKVMTAYQKLYHSSLLGDMQNELQSSEYTELLAILSAKPETYNPKQIQRIGMSQYEAWAKRLKAAFDKTYGLFSGTDEAAIKAVFMELPTQNDFAKTAQVYASLYAQNLITDLKSELEFWEYEPMMRLLLNKPKS